MALPRSSYGRTATLLVLAMLLLTVCAAVYLAIPHLSPKGGDLSPEGLVRAREQRVTTLITILLISGMLIVLFAVGAYLLIHVGRVIARERVGGKPTEYVDAWQRYRLSDEQISAATTEERPDRKPGGRRRRPRPDDPDIDSPEKDESGGPDEPPPDDPRPGPRPKRGPDDAPAED